jgi:hypothetical protein
VAGASVGYSGTETPPASQIAKSLISQCAVFFDISATRSPVPTPCACCRCAAMRRAWSSTSRQVKSRTAPPPMGCVSTTRSGAVDSQWYRRCKASASGVMSVFIGSLLRARA